MAHHVCPPIVSWEPASMQNPVNLSCKFWRRIHFQAMTKYIWPDLNAVMQINNLWFVAQILSPRLQRSGQMLDPTIHHTPPIFFHNQEVENVELDMKTKFLAERRQKLTSIHGWHYWNIKTVSKISIRRWEIKDFWFLEHGKRSFGCGGSLINQNYVLTGKIFVTWLHFFQYKGFIIYLAAHCLDPSLPQGIKLISVRLGEWDTKTVRDCDTSFANEVICNPEPPLNVQISEKIPHENYVPKDRNHYNDIALLRLERPVRYSDFIQPICLPTRQLKGLSYVGESMIVAG